MDISFVLSPRPIVAKSTCRCRVTWGVLVIGRVRGRGHIGSPPMVDQVTDTLQVCPRVCVYGAHCTHTYMLSARVLVVSTFYINIIACKYVGDSLTATYMITYTIVYMNISDDSS